MILPPPPPKGHSCARTLPHDRGGYGSTGHPEGTLIECPGCGRWYKCVPAFESLGPTDKWIPLRWYHRRSWRRVYEQARW